MKTKIINYLKNSNHYLSGEDISRKLNISRSAIWKYIEDLRRDGFEITAVPHLGYLLKTSPDKLLPSEIKYGLDTDFLGKNFIYFDSVGSTMEEAFKLGMEGACEGTVVCAEAQTKGKGRMGRRWSSPKGKGIYCSFILRPKMGPAEAACLTLMSAVAVCEAVRKICDVNVTIKWPNDLLIEGKKVAGILTELSAEMDRIRFVVIGIGVNVNSLLKSLPENSVSLRSVLGRDVSRSELLREILCSFERWYLKVFQGDFSCVIKRWKELSSTLGKKVCITEPWGSVQGVAIDLSDDGALLVEDKNGVVSKKMTGDVVQI